MTDFAFYKYTVKWYDESERKTHELCGLTVGSSYQEATARIMDYYGGDKEIVSFSLEGWDEWNCFEMPADVLRAVEMGELPETSIPWPQYDPNEVAFIKMEEYSNAAKLATVDDTPLNEIPVAGYGDPNAQLFGISTQPIYATIKGARNVQYYANSEEELKNSLWYKEACIDYGEENIIISEVKPV